MSAPRYLDPASSVLAYFGAELRRLRAAAGISQEDLAQRISYSASLVGMIETARRAPARDFALRCDGVLDTGGTLARLWPLVSQEALPRWFRPFAEIEREATSIRTWEPLIVPGLLQTQGYARALITGCSPVTRRRQSNSRSAPGWNASICWTGPIPRAPWRCRPTRHAR